MRGVRFLIFLLYFWHGSKKKCGKEEVGKKKSFTFDELMRYDFCRFLCVIYSKEEGERDRDFTIFIDFFIH